MKGLLLIFSVFCVLCVTGCSDIKTMNTNMEESIQSVKENTKTVQHSSEVISKNTEEISRSTTTMRVYLPPLLIVIILILFIPSIIMIKNQRKFLEEFRILVSRLKK
jgi:hypothetical protein